MSIAPDSWVPVGEPQIVELAPVTLRVEVGLYKTPVRLVAPGLLLEGEVSRRFFVDVPPGMQLPVAEERAVLGCYHVRAEVGVAWCPRVWRTGPSVHRGVFVDLRGADLRPLDWPPQDAGVIYMATANSAARMHPLIGAGELLEALFQDRWSLAEISEAFAGAPEAAELIASAAHEVRGELGEAAMLALGGK